MKQSKISRAEKRKDAEIRVSLNSFRSMKIDLKYAFCDDWNVLRKGLSSLMFISYSEKRPPENSVLKEPEYICLRRMFSKVFSKASSVELKTVRYLKELQTGVFAKYPIQKGEIIDGLNGKLVKQQTDWLCDISTFTIGQVDYLLLGPARLLNSSCTPNVVFKNTDGLLSFRATKPIQRGGEILVNYGSSYFDEGECKCSACKKAEHCCRYCGRER